MPSTTHLNTMLEAETFLQQFRSVDQVVTVSQYSSGFTLTSPGYNDGGVGDRTYFAGQPVGVETAPEAISRFLDVMEFATEADRTNAVAAALTVKLRNHWAGAKPLIAVTSSKSHGGKETVINFAAGRTSHSSLSLERQDWALQKNFAAVIQNNPEVGLLNIENIRLAGKDQTVSSAFLERFLTDPEPVIHSTGTGSPKRQKNHFVVACSTNSARISEDLLNRALPIRLEPVGDVANRRSPIGNPKLEYLPSNRERIEAELHGMIEQWKDAGRPLDETVSHSFTTWARTIGGILTVARFDDFLGNYGSRKTADDPVRFALGLIGASQPDAWLRPQTWVLEVEKLGLVKRLVSDADRDSLEGRMRGLGFVLSAHRDETFTVETEDEDVVLRLERCRRRFDGTVQTRYRFSVLDRQSLPEDAPSEQSECS